jgi:serine/threonine protein kinase
MKNTQDTQLKIGETLQTSAGPLRIINFIAAGGQGEVYKVAINGNEYALKWYFSGKAPVELKNSLRQLISKKSPSIHFLWPKFIVEKNSDFGYVMDLRKSEYRSMQDFMLARFDISFKNLMEACIELTDSFQKLHAKGLSYQDISFGNIFLNPNNGNILVCDNDNVTTNGETIGSIIGTPKFMAPELVIGKVSFPNSDTDLFSEAILLFYMLTKGHPFEGKKESVIHCMDNNAQKKLYGTDPVFIYHPTDLSNRPVQGVHNGPISLWKLYPNNLQNLFIKTFTTGIKDVNSRTRDGEWRKAFLQFKNNVYICPICGQAECIYDIEKIKLNGKASVCPRCKKAQSVPRIRIDGNIICLDNNRKITKELISKLNSGDETIIANFNLINQRLYLTNLSQGNITIKRSNNANDLKPNDKCEIFNDDDISFFGSDGKVRF